MLQLRPRRRCMHTAAPLCQVYGQLLLTSPQVIFSEVWNRFLLKSIEEPFLTFTSDRFGKDS